MTGHDGPLKPALTYLGIRADICTISVRPSARNAGSRRIASSEIATAPSVDHRLWGRRCITIITCDPIDPDLEGKILWRVRVGEGDKAGGSQWGSASDGRNMYVANSDLKVRLASSSANALHGSQFVLDPLHGGGLVALDLKTGNVVWNASPPTPPVCSPTATDCSPAQSAAVTVIPGVVFSGSVDGHLRAYATESGQVLWDEDTAHNFDAVNGGTARGGSLDAAGPAVVGGMVFVNSGYGQWGGMPGNVLLAFSVNGQ